MQQRLRAMPYFGTAECFGMQPAGFLAFERRLLGDTQPDATSDYIQVAGIAQGRHRRAPVELPGFRERFRRSD